MRTIITVFVLLSHLQLFAGNNSPVRFLKNKGQWSSEILFQGTSTVVNVSFLRNGLSFGQSGEEIEHENAPDEHPYLVWNMMFVEASGKLTIKGTDEKQSVVSWLYGNDPANWIIRPEEYTSLKYESVFEKIDLIFYGERNDLKYDYIIHPGGKISDVKNYYAGVAKLSINAKGELEVATVWNVQVHKAPVAWQMIKGKKELVNVRYTILNDSTFGFFAPGGYNSDYDLVIDPLFEMVWASYTQATGYSNNQNYCFGSTMDQDGNVYMTGQVDNTFPTTPGAYSGPGAISPEIFVAKFSSDGTTMLYSTYLPGNSSEHGVAIAADNLGRAYVTGVVDLNITGITNFPSTANAYQPVHDQGSDAFLTVLNPTGTGLVYSTFLGGTGGECGYGIKLGAPGIAYIVGSTSQGTFPTKATNVFSTGDNDLFVAKFDINQSGNNSLIYSTRIGAGPWSSSHGRALAVNSAGNVFVTGTLGSGFGIPNFPRTAGAFDTTYNTGMDNIMSYVLKLSANTPVSLEYSTYIGPGTASGIAVHDATGEAIIVGTTSTFTFPTTPGVIQPAHGGTWGSDAYVMRMNATGTGLVYSTFLGGADYEGASGVAVNSAGEAYITGIAQTVFPTSPGAYQENNAGSYDFYAVHLNAAGTAYACGGSTYIGGSDADYTGSFYDYPSPRISLIDHGGNNDTILISSTSHSQDFPTTPGVYGPVKVNGIADQPVFFKMTCFTAALPTAAFLAPDSICPGACIDFLNQSQNGSGYLWTFQGASVSSSTDVNPVSICYATPGTYAVTLVATNANGSNSVTSYITVYPSPPPQGIQQSGDTLIANQGAVSYQWYYNGNIIAGATNYFHIAQASGNYNVVATDANGCEVEAVIFDVMVGIHEIVSGQSLLIYPNPAGNELTIVCREQSNGSPCPISGIAILDAIGQVVLKSGVVIATQPVIFDIKNLSPGVYFLQIEISGEKIFQRFIKKAEH